MGRLQNISSRATSKLYVFFTLVSNEKVLVDRLEADEEMKEAGEGKEIKIGSDTKRADSKWKNKFITIWKQGEAYELRKQEKVVGPENFKAVMKLG